MTWSNTKLLDSIGRACRLTCSLFDSNAVPENRGCLYGTQRMCCRADKGKGCMQMLCSHAIQSAATKDSMQTPATPEKFMHINSAGRSALFVHSTVKHVSSHRVKFVQS